MAVPAGTQLSPRGPPAQPTHQTAGPRSPGYRCRASGPPAAPAAGLSGTARRRSGCGAAAPPAQPPGGSSSSWGSGVGGKGWALGARGARPPPEDQAGGLSLPQTPHFLLETAHTGAPGPSTQHAQQCASGQGEEGGADAPTGRERALLASGGEGSPPASPLPRDTHQPPCKPLAAYGAAHVLHVARDLVNELPQPFLTFQALTGEFAVGTETKHAYSPHPPLTSTTGSLYSQRFHPKHWQVEKAHDGQTQKLTVA